MSHQNNTRFLEDAYVDFDTFISLRKFDDASALLDNMWELGFKEAAITLGRKLLAAKMRVSDEPKDSWEKEEDRALERDSIREYEGAQKEVW